MKVSGDVLTLNNEVFDFTDLPEGAVLPRTAINSEWMVGDVRRTAGSVNVGFIFPIAIDASESARFPKPINVTQDGSVELPK